MATFTLTAGTDGYFQKHSTEFTTISKTVDFSNFQGTSPVAAGVAADVAKIISIPANFAVQGLYAVVSTALTGSSTFLVGDATDVDGWIISTGTATVGLKAADGAYVTANGKFYTTATDLLLTLGSTAPVAGVVTVYVVGFQL
jgi:hypothetical protein